MGCLVGPEPSGKAGAVLNRWRTIADMSERNGARSRLGFASVSLACMGCMSRIANQTSACGEQPGARGDRSGRPGVPEKARAWNGSVCLYTLAVTGRFQLAE